MSKPSSDFPDLKSSFETRSRSITPTPSATFYQSNAGDLANMSTDKQPNRIPSIVKTIDSVLDTSAAKPAAGPTRPLARIRPSWIGPPRPERPTTPGVSAMKQQVTIHYASPGLQPPVYIFTNLSDPQWEAVQMDDVKNNSGEHRFFKDFMVEEGEYQYKFRLGPGDWWVCDDSGPTVDDGSGNKNNLLVVKGQSTVPDVSPAEQKDDKTTSQSQPQTTSNPPAILLLQPTPQSRSIVSPVGEAPSAPLMKHETFQPDKGSESQQTPEHEVKDPMAHAETPNKTEDTQFLMKHETLTPESKDDDSTSDDNDDDSSSSSSSSEADNGAEDPHSSPLLRHESLVPSSLEQENAPLFRHESIGLAYNHHEAAADDMAADDAVFSSGSDKVTESSVSIPLLPSVREAESEEEEEGLQKIREVEEQEFEKEEATGEEMDPLLEQTPTAPMTPPLTPKEPDDADFEPEFRAEGDVEGTTVVNETIIIEVVEQRRGFLDALLEKMGGSGNAM